MARFTKKPVTIDAILAGDVLDAASNGGFSAEVMDVPQWIVDAFTSATIGFELNAVLVNTHHGQARAERADWIIRGVDGELYPCKADVFAKTYDDGDGVLVNTIKGDLTPEQFAEFKRKWTEDVRVGSSRAVIVDANNNGDLVDDAWGLLANVSGGRWEEQAPEWQEAMKRWRDEYHKTFPATHDTGMNVAVANANMMARAWNDKVTRTNAQERLAVESGWVELKDQPPPRKRDDLKPSWEVVVEEFRDRYMKTDISSTELSVVNDVLDDMIARDATGRERYGVPLTAYNGRDQLVDAYQEALDFAVYLRSAMAEGLPVSGVYSNVLHNIFWLRATINGRVNRMASP